jgi:hypothetical protein
MVAEQKIPLEKGNFVYRVEKRGNSKKASKKFFAKRNKVDERPKQRVLNDLLTSSSLGFLVMTLAGVRRVQLINQLSTWHLAEETLSRPA